MYLLYTLIERTNYYLVFLIATATLCEQLLTQAYEYLHRIGVIRVIRNLLQALRTFTHEAREISYKRDKKDPEYTFYDASVDSGNNEEAVVMTAYKVKPAVFDLVVSIGIAAYLGALYLFLQQASSAYSVLAAALSSGLSATSSPAKTNSNGVNGHSSNGKVKTH